MGKRKQFKCSSEAQKKAIRRNYAIKAKKITQEQSQSPVVKKEEQFPTKFPFWARFKPNKNRTTLVIDEEKVKRKNSDIEDDCYVHREAVHESEENRKYIESGDYEEIYPNPDVTDPNSMYLKRPRKRPKKEFSLHNKKLNMPEYLQKRYEDNNKNK